ncbi:pirin family protein [Methylobacterium sp. C25]|uniref:pirin family protein n=1 Tax=Methylobacterium sp. C25 TaxID=2721622 RepID=UPI001F22CDA3|nr:pirin family protein [Methylobacterium sp. C25]
MATRIQPVEDSSAAVERMSAVVAGIPQVIGNGFNALHFSEEMFGGGMDPLLMVDHFVMTAPTFEPHLHAGMSAVTAMFEDSVGDFLNRDTLGNNVTLKAGDLYWLAAASGAAHEEKPDEGARVHGLQVFVDLPARLKSCPARAVHVEAADVRVAEGEGYRVRVVLGQTGEVVGAGGTPEEMTLLDGQLDRNGLFSHRLREGQQVWIYAVAGGMTASLVGEERRLREGTATTVAAGHSDTLFLETETGCHFVVMAARPVRAIAVQHGPTVMAAAGSTGGMRASRAAALHGRLPS